MTQCIYVRKISGPWSVLDVAVPCLILFNLTYPNLIQPNLI